MRGLYLVHLSSEFLCHTLFLRRLHGYQLPRRQQVPMASIYCNITCLTACRALFFLIPICLRYLHLPMRILSRSLCRWRMAHDLPRDSFCSGFSEKHNSGSSWRLDRTSSEGMHDASGSNSWSGTAFCYRWRIPP